MNLKDQLAFRPFDSFTVIPLRLTLKEDVFRKDFLFYVLLFEVNANDMGVLLIHILARITNI